MRNGKIIILISIVICAISAYFCPAQTTRKTSDEKRKKALELLDKYAATQDKIQSFILKCEDSISHKNNYNYVKNYGKIPPTMNRFTSSEVRFDGNRCNIRQLQWGDTPQGVSLPKDKAVYGSTLWDGKEWLSYSKSSKGGSEQDSIIINRKQSGKDMISTMYDGRFLRGFLYGNEERLDFILRQANNILLRDETEKIGDSQCYVIDALTKRGRYTVYIDPEHGYNTAKILFSSKEGDLRYGQPLPKGWDVSVSVKDVFFKQIDDVWVPIEGNKDVRQHSSIGFLNTKYHHKITEIKLNPDHDALGSFIPDDYSNGAKVGIIGVEGIQYRWQDGNLVDANGKVVMSYYKKPNKPNKDVK